jgi:hypothetical protein
MPKKNWKEGPPSLIKAINSWLGNKEHITYANGENHASDAETWLRCSQVAFNAGYDFDPPLTPVLDRIEELRAAGAFQEIAAFRRNRGAEEAPEARARARWLALRRWAAEPSAEELAEQARAAAEERAKQEAIDRRTAEILAEQDRASQEKRRAAALKQAEKELT